MFSRSISTRPAVVSTLVLALALVAASTSTSMAGLGDCAQPLTTGDGPSASDCAYILKAAVGAKDCEMCVCDVNNSTSISSADALICLKNAVGQDVAISCPDCAGVTTTTVDGGGTPSTTSTSTTSTTTTIPVRCNNSSDCSALPSGFRCNPNNDTCEKPCTKDGDCHDFYDDCNTTTGYCQETILNF